jgi:hypothetical protein
LKQSRARKSAAFCFFAFWPELFTLQQMKGIILAGGVRRSSIEHSPIQL